MREIKFRIWDLNKKRFLTLDDYTPMIPQVGLIHGHKKHPTLNLFYNPDIILQQWTGLKDKNGKDVYEGDIIADVDVYKHWDIDVGEYVCEETPRKFKIVSDEANFFGREYIGWIIQDKSPKNGQPVKGLLNGNDSNKKWVVVGNIFDV